MAASVFSTWSTARPPSAADQQRSQWMARLPDDPGGLLRERIRGDYLRKQGLKTADKRAGRITPAAGLA